MAAVTFSIFALPAHAVTVENGSFEDIGDGTLNGRGWNHFSDVPGWTGDPNVEIQSNSTLGSIDTPFGTRYVELDTNQDAGIFQDISLSAGSYMLSFWYSPRVNASPTTTNNMSFSVGLGGLTLLDGTVNGAPNTAFPHGVFTEVTGQFSVAQDATVRLAFNATGGSFSSGCGNCGALIDNVQLSAVPLPASGMLLIAGFGGLFAMRRTSARAKAA
ncbi:MAG: VPLPA-CTERM sorting domain-containing protein [Pseudomonadota bacterium]